MTAGHTISGLEQLSTGIQAMARSDPGRVVTLLQEILRRQDDWLDRRYQVVHHDEPTTYPLYDAPDGSCSMVSLILPPGKRTPIHTHAAWAVLGVYRGRVRETWFRSVTSERAGIVPERTFFHDRGAVNWLPVGQIHAAAGLGKGPTVTIQIYGASLDRQGASLFDQTSHRIEVYHPHYRKPARRVVPSTIWTVPVSWLSAITGRKG